MNPYHIVAILKACLARGFVPPLYMCAVSVNGSVLTTRFAYTPDETEIKATLLTEHMSDGVYILPVNLMITDTRGEAARAVLQYDGWNFADLN